MTYSPRYYFAWKETQPDYRGEVYHTFYYRRKFLSETCDNREAKEFWRMLLLIERTLPSKGVAKL